MSTFWIFIGLLTFCMPHFASAGAGAAWPFAPYAGECAAVLLVLTLAAAQDAPRVKRLLPAGVLAATLTTLAFEAICALVLHDEPAPDALALAEELLHALSMALWCAQAVLKGEGTPEEAQPRLTAPVVAVSLAGVLAGGMWFAFSQVVALQPLAVDQLELVFWLACAVWALPLVVLVWALDLNAYQHATIAASPFMGALVANRIWQLAVPVGSTIRLPLTAGVTLALPAVFSLGMLVLAWLMSSSNNEQDAPAEEPAPAQAALPTTKLPINQLAGYPTLTERERQTIEACVAGATTEEIAASFGIAAGTVSTYRTRAYAKLGVSSTQDLLSRACELLEHSRLYLVPDEEPAEEAVLRAPMPALQTIPERFIPPVVCAACAVVAMLIAGVARVIPVPQASALVLCGAGVLLIAVCYRKTPAECSLSEQLTAICIGVAAALTLATTTFCPAIYFVSRLVLLAGIVAAAAWCTWRAYGLWSKLVWRTLGACGLMLIATAPPSLLMQALARGLLPFAVAALLLVVTVYVRKRAVEDETARVAAIVLEGDERIAAYLMGRGLPDLQAKVVLLTARGFSLGSIAKTLCISSSTVSEYRTRAYKVLGVHSKDELNDLLAAEAGL